MISILQVVKLHAQWGQGQQLLAPSSAQPVRTPAQDAFCSG